MKDAIVSGIDRHVVDPSSLAGEQHEVTRLQRGNPAGEGASGGGLLPRGTRKIDSMAAEDVLDEAGAIETGARRLAAIHVPLAEIALPRGKDPGCTGSCHGSWRPSRSGAPRRPRSRTYSDSMSTEGGDERDRSERGPDGGPLKLGNQR